ncbi:hypothetical protein DFH08DRAFT_818636 [Mycena albidolilacea]|uniref:Uncharacterized protein n=1 Tax=Mycena albidolilacea TaxID=1033008 RepID=A0AAD6ZFN9_9AGAR|nr:hypothetical protein DFH08DRAFT_818636 [Mycena albidolilacea]
MKASVWLGGQHTCTLMASIVHLPSSRAPLTAGNVPTQQRFFFDLIPLSPGSLKVHPVTQWDNQPDCTGASSYKCQQCLRHAPAFIRRYPKFNGDFTHNHPAVIMERLAEVEEFARVRDCTLHTEVLDLLFVLLAIVLELPGRLLYEDPPVPGQERGSKRPPSIHELFLVTARDQRPAAELDRWTYKWLNPELRVDLGSFTLLFCQPVAALQIRYPSTNEWKWVKLQDATITMNTCDALQFLTAGYVKSTVELGESPKEFA